jgi:hypothetical protein
VPHFVRVLPYEDGFDDLAGWLSVLDCKFHLRFKFRSGFLNPRNGSVDSTDP